MLINYQKCVLATHSIITQGLGWLGGRDRVEGRIGEGAVADENKEAFSRSAAKPQAITL